MTRITDFSQLPCSQLRGVGKAIQEKLSRLGIVTIQDLLFHLPFRYEDRTRISPLNQLRVGVKALVEGVLESVSFPRAGKTRLLCELRDGSRHLRLRFFHVYPSHKKMMEVGARLRCFGELGFGPTGLEMVHPELEVVGELPPLLEQHLRPVYPTTDGITQNAWRKMMQQALILLSNDAFLQDFLPPSLLQDFAFPSLREALLFVHQPPKDAPQAVLEEKNTSRNNVWFLKSC